MSSIKPLIILSFTLLSPLYAFALRTPLVDAAIRGDIQEVEELIKQETDPNSENALEALTCAGLNGRSAVIRTLSSAGVSAKQNCRRATNLALVSGIFYKNVETIQALLEAGAKIDEQRDERTALMDAAKFGRKEAVIALINAGANLHIRSAEGTAREIAESKITKSKEYLEIANILADAELQLNLHTIENASAVLLQVPQWCHSAVDVLSNAWRATRLGKLVNFVSFGSGPSLFEILAPLGLKQALSKSSSSQKDS